MLALLLLSSAVFFFQAGAGAPLLSSLDQFVADHNWPALESALKETAAPSAIFYRSLLFNRLGQYQQSQLLLEPLMFAIAAGSDRTREKQARLLLADDDFRTFRYQQAAEQYAALEKCCAAALDDTDGRAIELPSKLAPLLTGAPAQTLDLSDTFNVPMPRNVLGVREVEVFVDGHPSRWLFDPTANFTLLSRSQAKQIGLKLIGSDTLAVRSITGEPIHVQAAVIPQLKFGAAFFRNVPAAIYADEDLYDQSHHYQIQGVLAQPLLAALGAVTVSDDDHLTILRQPPLTGGAPLFSDGERLLAEAGATDAQRLYAIDPGRTESHLSSRYHDEHPAGFAGQTPKPTHFPDSKEELPIYTAETITLDFGETAATFHDIPVMAKPAVSDRGPFYGTLGANALDQLASYTFDFRSMRFIVRVHAEQ